MKIHTLQIPPEGLHLEGETSSEILNLTGDPATAVTPIFYSLEVGLSDDGLFAVGRLHMEVECVCVRCLEKYRRPLEVNDFATQVELEEKETVDLTDQVREDMLLALPAHPHCDWSGEKVCKAEFPDAIDPNLAAEDRREVWKGLDKLKL